MDAILVGRLRIHIVPFLMMAVYRAWIVPVMRCCVVTSTVIWTARMVRAVVRACECGCGCSKRDVCEVDEGKGSSFHGSFSFLEEVRRIVYELWCRTGTIVQSIESRDRSPDSIPTLLVSKLRSVSVLRDV